MTEPRRDGNNGQDEQGSSPGAGTRGLGRRAASAYQGALEAVFAVVITAGLGYWLDARFGTAPKLLLAGLAVGFAAFFVRIWRLRHLMEAPGPERSEDGRKGNGPGTS